MFELTEEAIDSGIDSISGYLVAQAAERLAASPEAVAERFYASGTYAQLSDHRTGWYWDSILELLDRFLSEFRADEPLP
ncbi:MAG: hypothetical protein LBC97_16475 [Bifidobacteriaceae bacterium]|nr:hypothetical protein [Bifidobacteriaceae bacterium]